MYALLPTTLTALLLAAAAFSAQAQTPAPAEVIEPDGVCATIPDPDDPTGPEIADKTDPDCYEAGVIYQQVPDTHIQATVKATATDWATRCRALGKTVGLLGVGHGGSAPHTFETTTRTRAVGSGSSGCTVWTEYAEDSGRRNRTVYDCHEAAAHAGPVANSDGHTHDWLAEPWNPWQWTEISRWTTSDDSACPPKTDNQVLAKASGSREGEGAPAEQPRAAVARSHTDASTIT